MSVRTMTIVKTTTMHDYDINRRCLII